MSCKSKCGCLALLAVVLCGLATFGCIRAERRAAKLRNELDQVTSQRNEYGRNWDYCAGEKVRLALCVQELEKERDGLRSELKRAAEALGIEVASEAVELTVFRDRLLDVEKRLNLAKLELAESREDCRRTSEELGKALDQNDKLTALVEAKDHALAGLTADLDCCRQELARKPKCPCEQGQCPPKQKSKHEKKRRHHP